MECDPVPMTLPSRYAVAFRAFDKNGTGANTFPNRSLANRGNRSLPNISNAQIAMTMSSRAYALRLH